MRLTAIKTAYKRLLLPVLAAALLPALNSCVEDDPMPPAPPPAFNDNSILAGRWVADYEYGPDDLYVLYRDGTGQLLTYDDFGSPITVYILWEYNDRSRRIWIDYGGGDDMQYNVEFYDDGSMDWIDFYGNVIVLYPY